MLEIGSGATVHGIASASRKYTSIVQSDYVLDNCEELKKWHLGESTLDWTQFLELVLSIDEKKGYVLRYRFRLHTFYRIITYK